MSWNDEKIGQLKRLWKDGLTTSEIGKKLGISKNAVVGKAHRLSLEGRPSPIRTVAMPVAAGKSAASSAQKKNFKEEVSKKISSLDKQVPLVGISDLGVAACRWPIGDHKEAGFHFCGKRAIPGRPYCEEHAGVAFVGIGSKARGMRGRKRKSIL